MKVKTTKKLFAFIIVMMFFNLTQSAFSQKCNANKSCPAGYECVNGHCQETIWYCNCLDRGYGCNGNPKCVRACAPRCGVLADTDSIAISANYILQSGAESTAFPQSEKKSTKTFNAMEALQIIPGSKLQQIIHQIEWSSIDENGNSLE